MELLWCVVLIFVLGACHGASDDFASSESGLESLDMKLSGLTGRAGLSAQYWKPPTKQIVYQNITRIVGGTPTTSPIPYQVSLQLLAYVKWKHICGGSIISKNHVLTAAHCVDKLRPERMSLVAGASNWKTGGVRHNVVAYKKHPLYSNKGLLTNDLAIIKVTPAFKFNRNTIASISLSENAGSRVENNYPVSLTGWGAISSKNHTAAPEHLMILHYNTITNSECHRRGYKVTPNEICTLIGRNKGACVGDSGGPLVNRERNTQIGVVSYGSTTCASGLPDVFSRVSNFLPWIRKVVQSELP